MGATVLGRSVGERYTVQMTTPRHSVIADEPVPEGDDLGPTPYELLLSALGACTSMTLHHYARHKGWDLRQVQIELSHERSYREDCENCEDPTARIDVIERRIRLEGDLSGEQRARLLEIAERCPVHRTLAGEIEIRDTLEEDDDGA
jgi:putative redox protein